MDAKAFVFILFILFIGGFAGIIYETTAVDEVNRELESVSLSVSNVESHLKSQGDYLILRKEAFALLSALDILRKEADSIRKELEELRQRKQRTEESLIETVMKTRNDSTGLQLGDILLTTGVTLKNARINRVEGNITSVLHSEGIAKLEPHLLPQELKERFRFELAADVEIPDNKKPAVEIPASKISPEKAKLNEARLVLEKLQLEHAQLERERAQGQSDSAASSPSRRYYAKKREATFDQQSNALRRRIDAAQLEVRKAEQNANPH